MPYTITIRKVYRVYDKKMNGIIIPLISRCTLKKDKEKIVVPTLGTGNNM